MNLITVAIGALAVGFAVMFLRHGSGYITDVGPIFVVKVSIVAAVGIFGAVILIGEVIHTFNQPDVNYELETGEYMHCAQQDNNHLDCEVKKREDD